MQAESYCCNANHDVKIIRDENGDNQLLTVGVYNECKCDFWSPLCEDLGAGVACEYAAEYCCGDYAYNDSEDGGTFFYRNSPTCYCDFFSYAKGEFGHTLKPRAMNTTKEFSDPCGQIETFLIESGGENDNEESQTLVMIYDKTNGKNWTNNAGWTSDTVPHCQWYGISCNDDGRVTGIALRDNNLEGQFPVYTLDVTLEDHEAESDWRNINYGLANLYYLETLDLANNKLTGTIEYLPLYNLNSLTHFDVSGNQLSGGMDALITPSISRVNFNSNRFTSLLSFKKYKKSFQTLHSCDMSNNDIKIDAAELLENIPPNIEELIASNNNIHGTLPASLSNLPKLRRFDMSFNALSGVLPAFADSLQSLQELDFQANGFTGSIPDDLWRFQFLKALNLAGNKLAGTLSPNAGNTTVLKDLDLSSNQLSGQFPNDVANLYSLKTLDLANNNLTGTIDYDPLYNLTALTRFDVSGNQLSGEVDTLVAPSISYVNFSNNLFTSMRPLPFKVSALQTLRYCDVSNNAIEIDAAYLLENTPHSIEQFIASNNDIYGTLPASLNRLLRRLRRFDMSFNTLSGVLPVFEDSLLSLQQLDMSNQANGFTGSIPEDLWRLQSLKTLNLAGNKLTGTLSADVGNMAVLEELDLSSNRLSGLIPSQIGQLEGTLDYLDLGDNILSGIIPSQLGQLEDASVFLKGNRFDIKAYAPLSLCTTVGDKKSDRPFGPRLQQRSVVVIGAGAARTTHTDIADDVSFCPTERNALSDFYDSVKGAEWTNDTNWMDEYLTHCDWHGVKCYSYSRRVAELRLPNNGLSGRLSESIGKLTSMEVLDLSDNDIKGSIPTEIGLLSKLTYLRLSYNAFTGEAPESLTNLTNLELLQLQSNRITGMPNISKLAEKKYGESTFVTDCGVPSAFDTAFNSWMCCNAEEDCYPQEETEYLKAAGIFFGIFISLCFVFVLYSYWKDRRNASPMSMSTESNGSLEDDDKYALSKIGEDSVYSFFVTELISGWQIAFLTLCAQTFILVFFVKASNVNLQDDKTDIEFTWKCPRDNDVCSDKSDLEQLGWVIFCILMIAFLAKDMINGSKLIYHSSRTRHPCGARFRYFICGLSLCSITLFALYVSTVYNSAIATSNTDIILNSVVVLFVMDMDEAIFAALVAYDEKWAAHTAESEDTSAEAEATAAIEEMKKRIASQEAKISSQEANISSQQDELMLQKRQIARQGDEIAHLREAMQKIQDCLAAATPSESIPQCQNDNGNDSISDPAAESDIDYATMEGAVKDDTIISQEKEVLIPCACAADAEQKQKVNVNKS